MNCVIKQTWQDCSRLPHISSSIIFIVVDFFITYILFYMCVFFLISFLFQLMPKLPPKTHNNTAMRKKTQYNQQKRQKEKRNVVLVGPLLFLLLLMIFFLYLSLCFSRKAHIREQRWMSYLFTHQIIGNFAFHRVQFTQYNGVRTCVRVRISFRDNLSTVYCESYNLWPVILQRKKTWTHFRLS